MKDYKKICKSILLTVLVFPNVFSQDITLSKQPIPKSPDVASLLKFVDHPVSISTGLPEVNIPIYTIKSNYINIPVSLNYHSGGVKVTDVASSVGMGWTLQPMGIIAQNIKSMDDIAGLGTSPGRLNNAFTNIDDPSICDLKNLVENKIDAEPDIFTFTFCGNSGQFYIKNDYSIGQTSDSKLKIEPLPGFVAGQGFTVSSWKITDINGIGYVFSGAVGTVYGKAVSVIGNAVINADWQFSQLQKMEKNYYLTKIIEPNGKEIIFNYDSYSIRDISHLSDTKNSGLMDPISQNYQTRIILEQRIKSIIFENGKIEFIAGPNRCDLYGDKMLDRIIVYGTNNVKIKELKLNYKYYVGSITKEVSELTFNPAAQPFFSASTPDLISNDPYKPNRLFLQNVEEINTTTNQPDNKYSFEYFNSVGLPDRLSAQRDWWDYYNRNGLNTMLDNINQDPTTYVYTTQYRQPDLTGGTQGLMKKIIYPTGGYAEYEFEQNTIPGQTTAGATHPTVTYTIANGTAGSSYLGDLNTSSQVQIQFEVQACINGPLKLDPSFQIKDYSDNIVYSSQTIASILAFTPAVNNYRTCTLSFAAGNYKIYTGIAGNMPCSYTIKVLAWNEILPPTWIEVPQGGVRVKRSTLYDPITNNQLIKKYEYTDVENGITKSSGSLSGGGVFKTGYKYNASKGAIYFYPNGIPLEQSKTVNTLTSAPIYPLGNVYYNKITESRIDQTGKDLGRTEYSYINTPDDVNTVQTIKNSSGLVIDEDEYKTPLFNVSDNSWRRNKLFKKEDFINISGQYKSIFKEQYSYYPVFTDTIRGLSSTYHFKSVETAPGNTCPPYSLFVASLEKIGYVKYDAYASYLRLDKVTKQETTLQNNSIYDAITYEYSNATRLASKITETNSLTGKNITRYKYAGDYSGVTNNNDGIQGLQQLYAIGSVIESSKSVADAQNNEKLVSSSFTSYLPNRPLPQTIYLAETDLPVSNFTPSFVQNGNIAKDTRYKSRMLFNLYDLYGNILEQQKTDDTKEVYLWGYRGQYPVAKILKSDFATVIQVIDTAYINNPGITDAALLAELNKLRVDPRTKNALVSTYTYKPLIGMSSETDPTGKTTFYEYDDLNRLRLVKDKDGKVLKRLCYNYVGQPVNCN